MPSLETIIAEFDFPFFVKGARQTSKHQKSLSIIENADAFANLVQQYKNDPILHWQDVVVREYLPLRPIANDNSDSIPPSFEFRTFWYKGQLVGAGHYWFEMPAYKWSASEKADALAIASQVAQRVDVPFLVVDVAQRTDGQWIVIECNDGQESGYAGISPITLWRNIRDIEKSRS
ncbi:MAG: ATP-grasp domain-containing protein [Chloroflexota bacterium]